MKTNDGSAARPTRHRLVPGYWALSIGLHGSILIWLLLFSPMRVLDLQKAKNAFTAGSAKIAQVMDLIRQRQADLVKDRVLDLRSIEHELEDIEKGKEAEFQQFLTEFAQDAPAKAQQAQAQAEKAQTEALAAQAEAEKTLVTVLQSNTPKDWEAASAQQKKAQDSQMRADQAMERALQTLRLADSSLEEASQAQAEANQVQARADKAQLGAVQTRDSASWVLGDARNKGKEVQRERESVQQRQSEVAQAITNAAKLAAEAALASTNATSAKVAAAVARSEMVLASQTPKDKREAQRKVEEADRKTRQADEKAQRTREDTDRARNRIQEAQTRLQQAETRQAQMEREAAQTSAKAAEVQTRTTQTQADAKTLQAEAHQALQKAQQALASALQNRVISTNQAVAFFDPASDPRDERGLATADLASLYDSAVATEGRLTETYRRVRALDLAMIRQIPLSNAVQLTEVARTLRPDLKAPLRASVTDDAAVPAVRQAVATASAEISSMVAVGNSMLATAKGLDTSGAGGPGGATISMDLLNARSAQEAELAGLAAEDSDARAKDLAGAMKGPGEGGNGSGNGMAAGGGVGAGPARAGAGSGAAGPPRGAGRPGSPLDPPMFPKDLRALASRKVSHTGTPASWLFVDSWYLLGPFDNKGRANIDTKFPPETLVDRDATYVGKDNLPIRWEFFQSGEPRITPVFPNFHPERRRSDVGKDMEARGLEYIIYYAYTELAFEREQDLWIAVGSDDFSKVWINDQLVWASGKVQKSWRVDEGFRKVHFKAGVNRILYRVENGWHGTDFSLAISLKTS